MLLQDIPVGGCLVHFLPEWKKITTDKCVISIARVCEETSILGIKEAKINQNDTKSKVY